MKRLRLAMRGDGATVKVDGQIAQPRLVPGICHPFLEVESPKGKAAEFSVTYSAEPLPLLEYAQAAASGRTFEVACRGGSIVELKDPQEIFSGGRIDGGHFSATVAGRPGQHTAFLRVRGKVTEFWLPVDVEIRQPLELVDVKLSKDAKTVSFAVRNNAGQDEDVRAVVRCAGESVPVNVQVGPGVTSSTFSLPLDDTSRLVPGLNPVAFLIADRVVFRSNLECWDFFQRAGLRKSRLRFDPIDISPHFNDNLAPGACTPIRFPTVALLLAANRHGSVSRLVPCHVAFVRGVGPRDIERGGGQEQRSVGHRLRRAVSDQGRGEEHRLRLAVGQLSQAGDDSDRTYGQPRVSADGLDDQSHAERRGQRPRRVSSGWWPSRNARTHEPAEPELVYRPLSGPLRSAVPCGTGGSTGRTRLRNHVQRPAQ